MWKKGVSEASPLTEAREEHTATLLQNGQVLVIGGGSVLDDSGPVRSLAELFDPTTDSRTELKTGLTNAREDHTATCLQNGQVLVVGGRNVRREGVPVLASAELFDLSLREKGYKCDSQKIK